MVTTRRALECCRAAVNLARCWALPRRNDLCLVSLLALVAVSLPAVADCGGLVLHAHRGAPDHPENSLSAVRASLLGSWDGVEIDIQLLRDGTPVLHHDQQLGRTTSVQGRRAGDLDAVAWREIRLKNRKGAMSREPPPFLKDVLQAMLTSPKVLNVEMKEFFSTCDLAERTVRALHEGRPNGQWFVTSIERNQLACARQFDPNGYLGLIVLDAQSAALQDRRIPNPLAIRQPQIDTRWIETLLREVTPPVGLHLDAHTLESQPEILRIAYARKIPVFTYSLASDKRHVEILSKVSGRIQMWPTGAVIDGDPNEFCKIIGQ